MLDDDLLGQFAQASALLTWNGNKRFCGRCGAPNRMEIGGYRRVCTACGHQTFPRTDPVVIMLAIDLERDRCLLGRSPHFPPGMYSCLAGFVEPGESAEMSVAHAENSFQSLFGAPSNSQMIGIGYGSQTSATSSQRPSSPAGARPPGAVGTGTNASNPERPRRRR